MSEAKIEVTCAEAQETGRAVRMAARAVLMLVISYGACLMPVSKWGFPVAVFTILSCLTFVCWTVVLIGASRKIKPAYASVSTSLVLVILSLLQALIGSSCLIFFFWK